MFRHKRQKLADVGWLSAKFRFFLVGSFRRGVLCSAAAGLALAAPLALAASPATAAPNLVLNGDFELNSGLGQITPAVQDQSNSGNPVVPPGTPIGRTLDNWIKTCLQECGSQGFAFVVDSTADSVGFQSVFSNPFIKVWGPASDSQNGFSGSPDGGRFIGIDGDYGRSKLSQTIDNLTPGLTYNLAFQWAGSQFTDAQGDTVQWWEVSFGSSPSQDTPHTTVLSKGFSGWMNHSMQFIASAASQELSFTAMGNPGGLPPFLLLDGVSLTTPPPPTTVPGPLPLLGAGAALGWSTALRQRLRRSRSAQQQPKA